MAKIESDKRALDINTLFRRLSDARSQWDGTARQDLDFYLGNHFSSDEKRELQSRNQADITVDRIYPAIEQLKAQLTSRPPKFSVVAREDSDYQVSQVWRTILEYIWDISDGNESFKQAVHDYAVMGLGYLYAYLDKEADFGRGEIKFKSVSPFRVYVDPNSRNKWFDDASDILLSTILTKAQILDYYPELSEEDESGQMLIDRIDHIEYKDEDFPSATQVISSKTFTPAEAKDLDSDMLSTEKFRIIERFSKAKVPYYRVVIMLPQQEGQPPQSSEKVMPPDQFEQFIQQPEIQQMQQQGMVDYVEVVQTRIKVECALGNIILYEQILDTDKYPIVPFPNIWTNTPYPIGDVSKVKDIQRFINKMFSLIISHAQTSAGLKLLVPQGSIQDMEELERDWANPNATIEYDASMGEPHFPSPQPLPTSFYSLMQQGEHYIDLNMGIFEMQQGNPDAAPRTSSGTMMMEDFGARRSKSKLRDIEGSLKRLGQVIYNLGRSHYDFEKKFRIVQPNNDMTEYTVNQRFYDDKTGALQSIENDITSGQYDIKIIGSSTLPSNRYGELELYMQAYQAGIIDRVEVLKKSDIFDKEGVQSRIDEVMRLQQQLSQAQGMIKDLQGDLQTARRESVSARMRVETEKHKGRLSEDRVKTRSATLDNLSKLENAVKLESEKSRIGGLTPVEKSQKGEA